MMILVALFALAIALPAGAGSKRDTGKVVGKSSNAKQPGAKKDGDKGKKKEARKDKKEQTATNQKGTGRDE